MQSINSEDTQRLANDPVGFAMMMDNHELEQVIVAFVSVLNRRKPDRGG